jgi:tetratricopeptide (TPR) repeat protein
MRLLARHGIAIVLIAVSMQNAMAHADIEIQLAHVTTELESQPNDYALYLRRGELRRHQQDWVGAEADFARADRLGSAEVRDQLNLYRGRLYQEAGQSERAVTELDTYIVKHPENTNALRVRALASAQMGNFDPAIADYTRLIEMDSVRSPELWLERARLSVQTGDINTALAGIDEAIAEFGPLITLIEFGVKTEADQHNYPAALDRMGALPPILAESPKWLWRRGTLLEKLNRTDEAAISFSRARDAIQGMPVRRQQTPAIQDLLAKLIVQ